MTLHETPDAFAAANPRWEELIERGGPGALFLTPRWQQSWWTEFGGDDLELCLLLVRCPGHVR